MSLPSPLGRRSGVQICIDLLDVCLKPTLPTPIMYKTNLSWKPLRKWIDLLVAKELLVFEPTPIETRGERVLPVDGRSSGKYHTTAKGRQLVTAWRHVSAAFKEAA